MAKLFDDNRNYLLSDPELEIIGNRAKLAQWRHYARGPAFYKLGRKVIYRGCDLNAWAEAHRIDPSFTKQPTTIASNSQKRLPNQSMHATHSGGQRIDRKGVAK